MQNPWNHNLLKSPSFFFSQTLTPKWAFLPLSGAGAATDGGRFNRPGVEALYLAVAAETALREYRQGASISPPATLAAYHISLDRVADLSGGFDPVVWDGEWDNFGCDIASVTPFDGDFYTH